MKTSFIAPAVLAGLMSVALTFARPVQGNFDLDARNLVDSAYDALYIRDLEAEIFELEARNPMKLPGVVNKLPVPKLPKTETQIKPRPAQTQTQTQKQQPQQRIPASQQNPKTQTQPKPKTQTQTQQQRQGSPPNPRSKPAGSPNKTPLNTQPNGVPGNTNTNARTGAGQHRHRRPEEITIDVDNNGPLPGGDEKITVDF